MISVELLGIVNVTPDSFSDGGRYNTTDKAIRQALELYEQGATMVDIGGDSTRPGSRCVGPEKEWLRIQPVLNELAQQIPVSVDTHHAQVAERAIGSGACMINDVFAARDSDMFAVLKGTDAQLAIMYSCMSEPHVFGEYAPGDIIELIRVFFAERIEAALSAGLRESQLVLDTGMGGFLHSDPAVSWRVIENYAQFFKAGFPLLLGCSRKGFLKLPGETSVYERDALSAFAASKAVSNLIRSGLSGRVFVRCHEVRLHEAFLSHCDEIHLQESNR